MRFRFFLLAVLCSWLGVQGEVRMLVPGFSVVELPVRVSNLNNLRFAPDGTLTALAYDGKVHILRDSNGDGVEDTDTLFWDKSTLSVPVGMCWSEKGLYVSSHGKVSLLKDTNGDGVADMEEIVASGWPPTDVGSGGVDATAVTRDAQGNLYFGLLVADYSNPYRVKDGVSHYDIHSPRGTIQKLNVATGKLETIATGIRVPYALAFNRLGDLFNTDQEGETWCPNGNPLDELNLIVAGRNYGFPPRDDKYLTNLVSEAPVVAFGPQHQSACGLVFNEPGPKQGLFGPAWWNGDAFVCGESRGKIWRVHLEKTANGYVGKENLIARLDMLTLDAAISPRGDLYVCCHSGEPDWGTGPQGIGKIYRISYTAPEAPQPKEVRATKQMELQVTFDKAIDPAITNDVAEARIEFGEYVAAADRFEKLKPPYKVVGYQESTPRGKLRVLSARMVRDRTVALQTEPHPQTVTYALTLRGVRAKGASGKAETIDLAYKIEGEAWAPPRAPRVAMPERETSITGGDFERGRELFFSEKLRCSGCHRIRGEGATIAADLSNLSHRDPAAVLRDIREPSAAINPDYVAYNVETRDGDSLTGFIRAQSAETLRIIAGDGKERVVAQINVVSLRPSGVSLMPAGLIDGLSEADVRSLLTFLVSAPPLREKGQSAFTEPKPKALEKPLTVTLVASKQDHGLGQHDYPAWQTNWMARFAKSDPKLTLEAAWEWPSAEQWKRVDVVVLYCWNHDWSAARLAELDAFQARGGGLVLMHAACIADKEPEKLAERIGLAAQPGPTKYLHTPFALNFVSTNRPLGLKKVEMPMLDEPYWPMIGDTNKVRVLATANMEQSERPMIWTYQRGKGKVFVTIPGHYTWTWEDPWFEELLWSAITWTTSADHD